MSLLEIFQKWVHSFANKEMRIVSVTLTDIDLLCGSFETGQKEFCIIK